MELIGHVAVDSGQVLLVDPCYITKAEWQEDWTPGQVNKGYGGCCEASLSDDGAGEVLIAGVAGTGVCTSTAYGDGSYPVYRDGNKIIIDFDPAFDEDDEDED